MAVVTTSAVWLCFPGDSCMSFVLPQLSCEIHDLGQLSSVCSYLGIRILQTGCSNTAFVFRSGLGKRHRNQGITLRNAWVIGLEPM